MSQMELLNESEFLEEYEESMDIIEMMLPKFEAGIKESLVKTKDYLAQGDANKLREEFHSLKGMVGNFYSPILYDLAANMEDCAKNNSLDSIPENLASFEEAFPKVLELVAGFVEKYAS